jgi:hypothetical protein
MGFTPNESDKKVFKEIKLYTGIHNMKVVTINPTKEKLEEMGYKPQNDPTYLTSEGDVKKLRLDFHLAGQSPQGDKIMTKVAFFLENQFRVNKDGTKSEWINDFGRTAWSAEGTPEDAPDGLTWFKHETARRSHVGEADLHLFLVNWLNIGPDDEAKMDNFLAIFEEDYSELHGLLAGNIDNEVRVLLTVRDSKYQSVYNKYFDRASNKRTNYWDSHVKNQTSNGYAIKEDYQNSFALQEWAEPATKPDQGEPAGDKPKGDDPF